MDKFNFLTTLFLGAEMKSFLTLVALVFAMSTNTHAISVNFDFTIFSSGSDIYACNAALKHRPHDATVCYKRNEPSRSCSPNSCNPGQSCDCVCTGDVLNGNDQGEYRLDFMEGEYVNWTDHGLGNSGRPTKKTKEAGKYDFNFLVGNGDMNDSFDKELTKLRFNLGSERYGAEMILDVCYRSTQVEYDYDSTLNYSHDAQVSITDFSRTHLPYEALARLEVKKTLLCSYKDSRGGRGSRGGLQFVEETPYFKFNSSNVLDFRSKNISRDIENCVVRYTFREANREGLKSLRLWTKQEAKVCTYTSFNEPVVE